MFFLRRFPAPAVLLGLFVAVSGCATKGSVSQRQDGINDPYEKANRGIHAFNIGVDKFLFRPASKGYVQIVPEPMVDSFTYFSENLSMPGHVVNEILQGDIEEAAYGTVRFLLNSTIGFAGLADPATAFNVPQVDTDFGETLHVWGFGEGAYIELPLLGPSTSRDSIGMVADLFISPLKFAPVRPVNNLGVWAEIIERMGDRGRFADTVDSILYESADSYAQARVIYLQNRRFELAEGDEDQYLDLYEDPYADAQADPYEDPYAE